MEGIFIQIWSNIFSYISVPEHALALYAAIVSTITMLKDGIEIYSNSRFEQRLEMTIQSMPLDEFSHQNIGGGYPVTEEEETKGRQNSDNDLIFIKIHNLGKNPININSIIVNNIQIKLSILPKTILSNDTFSFNLGPVKDFRNRLDPQEEQKLHIMVFSDKKRRWGKDFEIRNV